MQCIAFMPTPGGNLSRSLACALHMPRFAEGACSATYHKQRAPEAGQVHHFCACYGHMQRAPWALLCMTQSTVHCSSCRCITTPLQSASSSPSPLQRVLACLIDVSIHGRHVCCPLLATAVLQVHTTWHWLPPLKLNLLHDCMHTLIHLIHSSLMPCMCGARPTTRLHCTCL